MSDVWQPQAGRGLPDVQMARCEARKRAFWSSQSDVRWPKGEFERYVDRRCPLGRIEVVNPKQAGLEPAKGALNHVYQENHP